MANESPASADEVIVTNSDVPLYYLDTNALRSLHLATELPILVGACKDGKIRLCISNVVLMELARQRYGQYAQDSQHPNESILAERKSEYFDQIYRQWRSYFLSNLIQIIDELPGDEGVRKLFEEFKFDLKTDNSSDQRDALIITALMDAFSPDQAILVCHEAKLIKIAKAKGFQVANAKDLAARFKEAGRTYTLELPSPKDAVEKTKDYDHGDNLMRLRSIYPALNSIFEVGSTPVGEALLANTLENMGASDKEIRVDILARVQALAPLKKDDLFDLMAKKASKQAVQSNAERLSQERILQDK